MIVTLPMPDGGISGVHLEADLAAAGIVAMVSVTVDGDVAVGSGDDFDGDVAADVLAGHVPPIPPAHAPLDEFGRLLTLLALYEGQVLPPASELAAMGGYTEQQLADEFYAWMEFA